MLLSKNQYSAEEYNVEFLLERPVGWSSACLDSTINYYLNCNSDNICEAKEKDNVELEKENV